MGKKIVIKEGVLTGQELSKIEDNIGEWCIEMSGEDEQICRMNDENIMRVRLVTADDADGGEDAYFGFGSNYHGSAGYVALDSGAVTDRFLDLVWARHYKKPLTVIETQRLIIREMTTEDLPALYELYGYPGMTEFVEPLYEYERELQFTKDYIENMYGFYGYGLWLVFRREDGALVGRAGLENRIIDGETQVELGYIIGRPFWRMQYATECCEAIIDYAFSDKGPALEKLALCTRRDNKPSIGLALKLGFLLYAENVSENMNLYYRLKA